MKGTGAKRNVCPGSCVSTGAKFPVVPVESAPMSAYGRFCTGSFSYTTKSPYILLVGQWVGPSEYDTIRDAILTCARKPI